MKKTIFISLLSALLSISTINAKEDTEAKIDYMAEIMKMEKEIQDEKRETESALKVNKKLDELQNVLSEKKNQNKK